jgi:glycosyltransferase involved in cell wall biosynthesis
MPTDQPTIPATTRRPRAAARTPHPRSTVRRASGMTSAALKGRRRDSGVNAEEPTVHGLAGTPAIDGPESRDGSTPRTPAPRRRPPTTPEHLPPRPTRPRRAPATRPGVAAPTAPATPADAAHVVHTGHDAPAVIAAASAPVPTPRRERIYGAFTPENTVFVSLCFEGPDVYSLAGGLGTRVTEFTESLAGLGYETHLIFVGDPTKEAVEQRVNGKLTLKRWSQWISRYYLNGVYDGEEQKLYDYNESVPYHVYKEIAEPAIAQGKVVVIIGEDWHTAEAICRTSDVLHYNNLRHRCILMWNNNSLMSLHRINWGRLNYASTITTVSRYMKHRLWAYNVNPLVIPNGIPHRHLDPVPREEVEALRAVMRRGDPNRLFLFKIGRFDPDKRWLMAVEAVARLKYSGHPVSMVIRGGLEPHGGEVINLARHLGLNVRDVEARRPSPAECRDLLRDAGEADIYNLRFFVPEEFVRVCNAGADAVLANSGHEPFGLVGLEVMAAGGLAFTGSTGEEYAISFENAVALETDDADEIVGYLLHLRRNPDEQEKIRAAGRRTAAEFTWEEVIENLTGKLGYLARKQSIALD